MLTIFVNVKYMLKTVNDFVNEKKKLLRCQVKMLTFSYIYFSTLRNKYVNMVNYIVNVIVNVC